MDDQSLQNVLALMRRIRGAGTNSSPINIITDLAGADVTPRQLHRIAANIQDQIEQSRAVIDNSNLVPEAKSGVIGALNKLESLFSLSNLGNTFGGNTNLMEGYISNFVILLSAAGVPLKVQQPEQADALAAEIDKLAGGIDGFDLEPDVKLILKRHLVILSTLLRHIPIFGLEGAMTSYFELVTKLRRAESRSGPDAAPANAAVMEKVVSWSGKIAAIDKIVNSGANIIHKIQGTASFLQYIPGLT